jgi:lactate dehydrogenase-like 2-hydroxyacid dehydrogenase
MLTGWRWRRTCGSVIHEHLILVRLLQVGPDLIRRFRRCKIIVWYGVGCDNVDLSAAKQANVMVGHVLHYCPDGVCATCDLNGRYC